MNRHAVAFLTGSLVLAATAVAQAPFEAALLDGTVLQVQRVVSTDGAQFELATAAGKRKLKAEQILSLHGAPVVPNVMPLFELGGGDRLRGVLSGGDSRGEWLELVSPTLGRVRLSVDRLACIVFRSDLVQPADLRLPDGVDEALFQRAGIGLDLVAGSLYQFDSQGIRFLRDGDQEPRWLAPTALVGLRCRKAAGRSAPPACSLMTRTGDRVGVRLCSWSQGVLELELEDKGKVRLPEADFACLLPLGTGVTFASALEPLEATETGYDGDVLYPYQRDSNVLGAALVGGQRAHARGLGVHSRSRLDYVVPADAAWFWTRVAIDQSALALPVRAEVHVEVRLDDETVFKTELSAGEGAMDSGRIAVKPGQRLALVVDFGKGRDLADRVDWLSPVFLPGPGR